MITLVAYYQSILSSGTLQALAPVVDPTVTEQGNDILVPDKLNQVGLFAGIDATASIGGATQVQLQSPSLREIFFPQSPNFQPIANLDTFRSWSKQLQAPIPLKTNEGLQFFTDAGGDGTTAHDEYGIVFLVDGAIAPAKGPIYVVRATAAIQQAVGVWVNGQLTFDQTLPVNTYDVVGVAFEATSGVAGRLLFVGASAVARPGALVHTLGLADIPPGFELDGSLGVLGSFNSTTPPSIEMLGGTAASQTVWLALVPH